MVRNRTLSPPARTILAIMADAGSRWVHGYDLCRQSGVKSGTLYPLLIRLEEEGYLEAEWQAPAEILQKVEQGVLTLNHYLGYDLNTVEFAIRDGVPVAIDFCNPAPDAEAASVGQANFEWVVEAVSEMAIRKAREHVPGRSNLSWGKFLQAAVNGRTLSELA